MCFFDVDGDDGLFVVLEVWLAGVESSTVVEDDLG